MAQLVKQAKKDPIIRTLAAGLVRRNGEKDYAGEARNLFLFVRDNIRYLKDVRGVETLHTPRKLLELKQGDCDDKSTLLAALLESIGHPARFVAIGFAPNRFDHVFVETKIGRKWVPMETTEGTSWDMGRPPINYVTRMEYHI